MIVQKAKADTNAKKTLNTFTANYRDAPLKPRSEVDDGGSPAHATTIVHLESSLRHAPLQTAKQLLSGASS
jgi:hypothetical protein